jgi:hypothetical protein
MDLLAIVDEKRLKKKLSDLSRAWLVSAERRSEDLFWNFMRLS